MQEVKQNKVLQKQVLKTLAAFMNSDGGTLLIGVIDVAAANEPVFVDFQGRGRGYSPLCTNSGSS